MISRMHNTSDSISIDRYLGNAGASPQGGSPFLPDNNNAQVNGATGLWQAELYLAHVHSHMCV